MNREFRLFSRPSFFEGMARVVDVCGSLNIYNSSSSENEADFNAILSDWEMVGNDIYKALERFEKEYKSQDTHEQEA